MFKISHSNVGLIPIPSIILALDLGTKTGFCVGEPDDFYSGTVNFSSKRFEGAGMRYLRFQEWLDSILEDMGKINQIYFEEVVMHSGMAPAHVYGGFMATLTSWCEKECIPYQGVPVKTIKKHITGTGNANKQMVKDAVELKGITNVKDDNEADAIALMLYIKEKDIWKK